MGILEALKCKEWLWALLQLRFLDEQYVKVGFMIATDCYSAVAGLIHY